MSQENSILGIPNLTIVRVKRSKTIFECGVYQDLMELPKGFTLKWR